MNEYGMRAQQHWRRWLPRRFEALEDPETFFAQLGEEIETRVVELSQALEGEDRPGEQYLEKLGRLSMAKLMAEEQAMKELALLEPEATGEEED